MIEVEELVVVKGAATICRVDRLVVAAGERLAIVGANGSGKTTLLRVLAELERHYRGRCEVAAPPRRRGYLHQQPLLLRGTVLGNLLFGLRAHGVRGPAAEAAARGWLDRFAIAPLADRAIDHLSGGEVRRVALARALVLEPALLLLDEPLADLDEPGAAQVIEALARAEHTTIVVATPTEPPPGLVDRVHHLAAR